jgi:hypothetical protein
LVSVHFLRSASGNVARRLSMNVELYVVPYSKWPPISCASSGHTFFGSFSMSCTKVMPPTTERD